MKVLVAGWFSFAEMGASAGDLLVRDLACEWLDEAGREYDVALAAPFDGGVDWRSVEPNEYADVVFVCGPFGDGPPITDFLARFDRHRLVGLNLTMLEPLEIWNPFDLLLERDSSAVARPDLAFAALADRVPVVGLALIDAQPEYGPSDLHEAADEAIRSFLDTREAAVVAIDTRLDVANRGGLRSASEIESLIARMDVIVSTRLHGLVLGLKHGVPVVAVDTVAGGAKVARQARTLGWPVLLHAEDLDAAKLGSALDYCLSDAARAMAARVRAQAEAAAEDVRRRFVGAMRR